MDNIYHKKCLELILAISRALDKLEEKDCEAAECILRKAWQEASGAQPEGWLLR